MFTSYRKRWLTCIALCVIFLGYLIWFTYDATQRMRLNRLLIDAIHRRDSGTVQDLLDTGADPDYCTDDRPFHMTTFWQSLWKHGKKTEDCHYGTALMEAASDSDVRIMQLLLDAGADVNAKIAGKITALESSAWGCPDCVALLIDHGAEVEVKDKYGGTALMAASLSGIERTVKILLHAGADPNARDAHGRTVLMCARKHPQIIALLKKAGAKE